MVRVSPPAQWITGCALLLSLCWDCACKHQHPTPINLVAAAASELGSRYTVAQSHALEGPLEGLMEIISAYAEEDLPVASRSTWWPNMGHIGQVSAEVDAFSKLAAQAGSTICEVGFNAGHSSAVFLSSNPTAVLYSFDIMTLDYSESALKILSFVPGGLRSVALIKRLYKNRFHMVKGSSFDTLPWAASQGIMCDLFSVDGDHSMEGAMTDYLNAIQMIPIGGTLLADDTTDRFKGAKSSFHKLVELGYLRYPVCQHEPSKPGLEKGWCWAKVASHNGTLSVINKASGANFKLHNE